MAENGVRAIDSYLFEDHPHLRRAAAECYTNMSQYPPFVLASGGRLPLSDTLNGVGDLGNKLALPGGTERVKLMLLYCLATGEDKDCEQDKHGVVDKTIDQENLALVLACSGALATMSYDPGIIDEIVKVNSWLEVVTAIAADECSAVQHRGAHLINNIVAHGPESLVTFMASDKSPIVEVLMALSQLADITDSQLPTPADIIAYRPRVLKTVLKSTGGANALHCETRQLANVDRAGSRRCAMDALSHFASLGLIQRVSITPNKLAEQQLHEKLSSKLAALATGDDS